MVLFSEQTMSLYAFRFTRQNDVRFAVRLLELNAESFPQSWNAADALGDGYRRVSDTTRALGAYTRALKLIGRDSGTDSAASATAARHAIEAKVAELRLTTGSRPPSPGPTTP